MTTPHRTAALALALAGCRVELGPEPAAEACADDAPRGEVWVYTSVYPHVAEALEAHLRAALPGIEPRFFQAGSEKVAQRAEAEWAAGSSPACVLLTSDPGWYVDLAARGQLRPHLAPTVLRVDRGLVDPDGRWTTARLSLVVLAAHRGVVDRPTSFAALAEPRFAGRITSGDPLASGTMFTWLAALPRETARAIEANGLVAAGGGSAVRERVDSGEKPFGVLLLENVLAADATNADVVYPRDGAVVVPGPVAIPARCPNPAAAEAVVDAILSEEGQRVLVAGDLYAALPGVPPPDGARPLAELAIRPWSPPEDPGGLKAWWSERVTEPPTAPAPVSVDAVRRAVAAGDGSLLPAAPPGTLPEPELARARLAVEAVDSAERARLCGLAGEPRPPGC